VYTPKLGGEGKDEPTIVFMRISYRTS